MASGGRAKRFRGNHTHGRGKKAGRGAGLRGGRGRAGANKHRYLMLQLLGGKHAHTAARPWGRVGFKYRTRTGKEKPQAINVGDLSVRFPGQAEVDLVSAGYGKLLGSGEIVHKVTVKVDQASPGAVEKVKAAGGTVQVLSPPKEKRTAPPAAAPAGKGAAAPATKDAKAGAPKEPKAPKAEGAGVPKGANPKQPSGAGGKPAKPE